MRYESITFYQLFMLIMLTVGLMDHVLIIPLLLGEAGRDSWISVLLTTVPFMLWITLLYYTMKRLQRQHLYVWLKTAFGSWLARIIAFLVSLYLFYMAAITMMDTVSWTRSAYFPQAPSFILALLLAALCFYNAHAGIHSIALAGGILLPIVVVLGFFVATANLQHKDYSLLLPLFANGWKPTLNGILYTASGLAEFIIILFMSHHLQSVPRLGGLLFLGGVLIWMILGPLTGALAEFGPGRAAQMRFPAFEEWRLVNLGRYVEHLDFLSIYQWMSGAYIRMSLAIFLIPDLFAIQRGKQRSLFLLFLFLLLAGTFLLPINDMYFMTLLYKFLPIAFILVFLLSIFLFLMTLLRPPKRTVDS